MIAPIAAPVLTQVKPRAQQMWRRDFRAMTALIQPVADALCEALELRPGWRVLDVGSGGGDAAIAASRLGCDVVGIDDVPAVLALARRRMEAEGVAGELRNGDAEAIPFIEGSFNAVLSVHGSMFAPNRHRAAAELTRVCRPGGRIGLATWIPGGFMGELLEVVKAWVPPPRGDTSTLPLGSEAYLSDLFGDRIESMAFRERSFKFRHRSAEALVDQFRASYGPAARAFDAVSDAEGDVLLAELVDLVRRHAGTHGPVAIPANYLEAVAIRSSKRAAPGT